MAFVAEVLEKLSASAKAFAEKVWPLVRDEFGGVRFEPIEGADEDRLRKLIDSLGVDGLVVRENPNRAFGLASRTWTALEDGTVFRGISLRLQRAGGDRKNTEYEKLRHIIVTENEPGYVHPLYTIQATFLRSKVEDEGPVYVTWVRTDELVRCIHHYDEGEYFKRPVSEVSLQKDLFVFVPESVLLTLPSARAFLYPPKDHTVQNCMVFGREACRFAPKSAQ